MSEWKDDIVNLFLDIRFQAIRKFFPGKLKNSSPVRKKGRELTFCDTFERVTWKGRNKLWIIGEHWGRFHPDRPNVYFGEPELDRLTRTAKFKATYDPVKFEWHDGREFNVPFRVSWLSTAKTFRQQYGRFECRMTLPVERAAWPAFWLWGPEWPPEIDMIEAYGGEDGSGIVKQCISVWRTQTDKITRKVNIQNKKTRGEFHEFALEWTPTRIDVYTDGIKVFQCTDKKMLEIYNQPGGKAWMLVNTNIQHMGGARSKHILKSEEPDYSNEFHVDYVRAYR